ncbi:NYN domain-containing protein [Bacilliculturomica massiliensis]|uniref:NYN domain-containing protein n=1 Tax=Bacilliculturomica massiliensis TaxID=1917867 RepID=UPI002ED4D6A5
MPGDKRFAVLIDADNISNKYVKVILDEISNDGVATYKRIYGDWTRAEMGPWKRVLLEHSITPIQQYGYTTGKNATDSAMIIDAMDILYSGNVEGFCLVSSDSDFTRLASRLRESGMMVVGMGEQKTPKAFISACNKFKYLDILSGQAAPKTQETRRSGQAAKRGRMTKAEKEAAASAAAAAAGEKAAHAAREAQLEREAAARAAEAAAAKEAAETAAAEKAAAKTAQKDGARDDGAQNVGGKADQPKPEKEKAARGASRKKGRTGKADQAAADAEHESVQVPEMEKSGGGKNAGRKNSGQEAGQNAGGKQHAADGADPSKEAGAVSGIPAGQEVSGQDVPAQETPARDAKDMGRGGKLRPEDVGIILFDSEEEYEDEPAEMTSLETIREALATMVAESADEDEWVFIGDLGNRLTKRYPDFDVRNYGFSKLTPFIKSLDLFEIKSEPGGNSNNRLVYVRERE